MVEAYLITRSIGLSNEFSFRADWITQLILAEIQVPGNDFSEKRILLDAHFGPEQREK